MGARATRRDDEFVTQCYRGVTQTRITRNRWISHVREVFRSVVVEGLSSARIERATFRSRAQDRSKWNVCVYPRRGDTLARCLAEG